MGEIRPWNGGDVAAGAPFVAAISPRPWNGLISGRQIGYSPLVNFWAKLPPLDRISAFMARATHMAAAFATAACNRGGAIAPKLLFSLLLSGPWAA